MEGVSQELPRTAAEHGSRAEARRGPSRRVLALEAVVAQSHPGRIVAFADGKAVPHADFRRQVEAWRAAFAASEGRHWALYLDDTLSFAAALFGAWHAGKRVFLCGDNLPATLQGLRDRVDGYAGDMPAEYRPLSPVDAVGDPPPWPPLDREDAGLLVYTSGSTGVPTLIDKRLRQLSAEVDALERRFSALCGTADAGAEVVVHGTVSHQHLYGLLFRVLWPLASGRPFASRLFFHEHLAHALGTHDSVLIASPAHLKRLPPDADWSSARSRVRAVFSSGGPLDEEAAANVRGALGVDPVEIFGSSETGGIASRTRSAAEPSAAPWLALPGVDWRIVDACLELRSPFLADAHWFRSDDRVEDDGAGGFRLLGRGDRIVKIEERRVSLTTLEAAIAGSDAVEDVRVLTIAGDTLALAAVVVPSADGWRRLEALGRWRFTQSIKGALASMAEATLHPQRWRYVSALPMNAQGKVTQHALQALFCTASDDDPGRGRARPPISKDSR